MDSALSENRKTLLADFNRWAAVFQDRYGKPCPILAATLDEVSDGELAMITEGVRIRCLPSWTAIPGLLAVL
jgi:hypothetical protein